MALSPPSGIRWARGFASGKIVLLLGLGAGPLQCAPYQAAVDQKWTIADGLPSSTITGIARSSDGLLWIGTLKGLTRFDGARFYPFTQRLPPNDINYLTSGPDGRIYLGTYGSGFATILGNRIQTFTRSRKAIGMKVSMILPDGDNQAWVATINAGLYHFQSGELIEVGSGILPDASIYGLAKTPDGVLWIGTGAGLFLLRNQKLEPYRPANPIRFPINDLVVTQNGSLFAGTEHGILKIEGDQWRSWKVKDNLPSDYIKVLAAAGNDLWIGTDKGLAKLSGDRIKRLGDTTCPIIALLPEVDGGVWFGCEDIGGLHRIKIPLLQPLRLSRELADAEFHSILEDRAGLLWITSNRGLVRSDGNKTTLYTTSDGLPSNIVSGISVAPDNSLWIGTDDGFCHLQNGRIQTFRTLPKGFPDQIYSILQDGSGNLWVGASRGLFRRKIGETDLHSIPDVPSPVWSLREDSRGNVWAATDESGLFRFAAASVDRYGSKSGLGTNTALDTWEAPNGDIWAATTRGLARIRNGKCDRFGKASGFPGGSAMAVVDDGKGRLWIRFTEGIFVVEMANLNRLLDAGSGTISGLFIGTEDGFGEQISTRQGERSLVRRRSGEIWCALFNGIVKADPSALTRVTPALSPELLQVVTDAGKRDLMQNIVIKPDDRNVGFTFAAPAYIGAKDIEYRYRLEGFDREWRTIGAGSPVMYSVLPPGKYRFEVSARYPYGIWSTASAPVDLQVLPRFYQTWWWYIFSAVALLLTIHFLVRLRLVTLRKQFALRMAERLGERSRVARELHDTLSRSLITILAQLEEAQDLLKVDPPALEKYLDDVCQLASNATRETRMSVLALRSPRLAELSLQELLQQSATKFSLSTSIQVVWKVCGNVPELSEDIKHEVIRIFEEALTNVREHSGANRVVLSAQIKEDRLIIDLQDNGTGFEQSLTENPGQGHFGVAGMRERAQNLRGELLVQSTPGCGTTISLRVPLRIGSIWKTLPAIRVILKTSKRLLFFRMGKSRPKIDPGAIHDN